MILANKGKIVLVWLHTYICNILSRIHICIYVKYVPNLYINKNTFIIELCTYVGKEIWGLCIYHM